MSPVFSYNYYLNYRNSISESQTYCSVPKKLSCQREKQLVYVIETQPVLLRLDEKQE